MVLSASAAQGQVVGYPPAQSPFRDLEYRQEFSLFTGYYTARRDPAGVAPQSGPMVGVRYEVFIGGPAQFMARLGHVVSDRTVLNPNLALDQRVVGTRSAPLFLADVGVSFNITGRKSYRRFVPVANIGLGLAADLKGADVGGFRFGTPFALSFGGGIRYVPPGPYQVRLDVTDYLYSIRYPNTYFTSNGGNPPIQTGSKQSFWTHNAALTLGASYQFFR